MNEKEMMNILFSAVDGMAEEYTDLWIRLCSFETRSDDFETLNIQSDYLAEYASAHGLEVRRTSYPAAGDSLVLVLPEKTPDGIYAGDTESKTPENECGEGLRRDAPVAVLGHMDTVHEKGAFGDPVVRREGNTLYGPGVADMKGGVCVALLALEALRKTGIPHPEIRLILNPDEESGEHLGGEARKNLFVEPARGCKAAFNCETGCAGCMTVGRKGVLRVAIDVKGIGAHAGNDYFKGASAIREMAYKIIALEKESRADGLTFNCGRIEGGTVVNIVPTSCHMEIDIRFLSNEQYEEALRIVQRVAGHSDVPGTSAEWSILHVLPAMEDTEGNRKLFGKIADFAAEYGLEELRPIVRGGGSDSAFTTGIGIPTVCSMGAVGDFVHTTAEEAQIDSLPVRAKILAGVIACRV